MMLHLNLDVEESKNSDQAADWLGCAQSRIQSMAFSGQVTGWPPAKTPKFHLVRQLCKWASIQVTAGIKGIWDLCLIKYAGSLKITTKQSIEMCKRDLSGILSNVGECKKMMVWSWVASLTITLSRFCAAWHFAMLCGSLFLHWHACHRLCNEHSEESGASSNALTTHWEKNQSHIRKSSRASGTQLQISQEIMYMINAIVFFLIKINNQLSLDLRFCDMFAKARFIFNF